MFTIYGGKQEFMQWDLDQFVTNPCMKAGDEVVFRAMGKAYETVAFVQDGVVCADVPNFLLQKPCDIQVDLGWGLDCHMDCRTTFTVVAKDRPADYVCPYNIKPRNNNGGGVSSWNDLTDKPFYEESGIVEILPECQPTNREGTFDITVPFSLVIGETYIVNWNGVEYTGTAVDGSFIDAAGFPVLVNDGADLTSGEGGVFAIVAWGTTAENGVYGSVTVLDGTTELTISIKGEGTTIHPLDAKFLPDGIGGILVVSVKSMDESTMEIIVSHTAEEILNAMESGKVVFLTLLGLLFTPTGESGDGAGGGVGHVDFASVLDSTMTGSVDNNGMFKLGA